MNGAESEATRPVESADASALDRVLDDINDTPLPAAPELGKRYTVLYVDASIGSRGPSEQLQEQNYRGALEQGIVDSLADRGEAYRGIIRETLEALAQPGSIGVGYLPDPIAVNQAMGADPVLMFNGEFTHQAEDLHINGAGIDFVFRRMYRNQVVFSGPLGANWDHVYNLHLKASDSELLLTTGELREQRYTRHPLFNYFVPPDGVDAIIEPFAESFVRRAPDGMRHIFEPDRSFPTFHRLAQTEDRFGHFLRFLYRQDEGGLLDQVVVNHPGRIVRFTYDTQGRITHITDYTGRTWRYTFDDLNDLVAVTTPATDRYQHGVTTRYEYRTAFASGLLAHNLSRIVDAAGQLYLENEYGESPGQLNFNRVTRQRHCGGETTFDYEDVVPVFDRDYTDAQRPVHQTTLTDRNGHLTHHVYNRFGNLLFKEQCILQDGLPRTLFERYRYNRAGQLTASLSPEGVLIQQLYERELFIRRNNIADEDEVAAHENLTPQKRMSFGRVLTAVRRGRTLRFQQLTLAQGVWGDLPEIIGGFESDSRDIIVKFTYEPTYGQLLTLSDPRFTQSTDPTTTAGEHPRYEETLTRYVYRGPGESPDSDPTRFLAEIRRPTPTLPNGALAGPVVEQFASYDERGRLLRHVNAVGTETVNTYFGDNDERAGYLQSTVVDVAGLAITTRYEVDTLGRVVAVHLPRSVDASDGRFVTRTAYNALDQITQVVASAPSNFETRRFYDQHGKLEREERDARDESGGNIPDAPEVSTFEYDEELNLVRETEGGFNLSAHLVAFHCYDAAGNRTLTLHPLGNQIRYAYDERMLPVAKTMGAGTDEAATTRTGYDADGRVNRTFDARGNATSYTLDPLGRVIAEEHALGHIVRREFDKAGNVVVQRVFERQQDGSYQLLSRSETEYDELGRAIRTGTNRFDDPLNPVPSDALADAFLLSPGPGELLVAQTFYDARGRVERTIDVLGRVSTFEHDALDRIFAQTDPMGNRTENHYDAHGNPVRSDRMDVMRDPDGNMVGQRAFSSGNSYDELDRMVSSTDSLGNTTRYLYDSRGNEVSRTDALGNVIRTEYDIVNRRVADIRDQTETGLGGGGPLESATTRFEYDINSNPVAVVDPLGRRTQYIFDALDRRRAIVYPDKAQTLFDYDPDGNLIRSQDSNGLRRIYTVDALGRNTRMDVDKSSLAGGIDVEGETFEEFKYDGLDRQHHAANDFARSDIRFNSLGWPLAETTIYTTPDATLDMPLVIAREFSHVGAMVGFTYPNGRRLRFRRDDLHRLKHVQNVARGADYPGNPATSDTHDIARMEYAGLQRSRCLLGNGAATRYSHDGAGRTIEIAHSSAHGLLLTIQYLFDAVGNVRVRNDIRTQANLGEAFAYDSLYRLANEATDSRPALNVTSLAPADTVAPDPIPSRQAAINDLIGPLALPPAIKTFGYDLVGNRNSERLANGEAIGYQVNDLDQYTTRNDIAFEYDGNGNLRRDGQREYVYDSLNRLVRVVAAATGKTIVRFFHNSRGRRVLELQEGLATHLLWDGEDLIAEYRNGGPFAQYVYGDDIDQPLQIVAEGREHWYHADLVGSVRLLTDRVGMEAASYRYAPFGDLIENVSIPYNPVRYTGRRFDTVLGTYDYRARQFHPTIGRFLQRDPMEMMDQPHRYSYTNNNPLAFSDPSGTERQESALSELQQGVRDLVKEWPNEASVLEGVLHNTPIGPINDLRKELRRPDVREAYATAWRDFGEWSTRKILESMRDAAGPQPGESRLEWWNRRENPVYGALTNLYEMNNARERNDTSGVIKHGLFAALQVGFAYWTARSAASPFGGKAPGSGPALGATERAGGEGWRLVTLPPGTKLSGVGAPGKARVKWGGFQEEGLVEYVRGNQWHTDWGRDWRRVASGDSRRTPIVEYSIEITEPTTVWASRVATQERVGLPHLGAQKIQYYHPGGFGNVTESKIMGFVLSSKKRNPVLNWISNFMDF